jgi:hypothetical protein
MGKEKFPKINRRRFLQAAGALGAASMVSNPIKVFAESSSDIKLLDFAHLTDVHIVDEGNNLRFEELKAAGIIPLEYEGQGLTTTIGEDYISDSTTRNQDIYSARTWNAVVRSINAANADSPSPMDFMMNTGDNTDTCLENELQWFIEIAHGTPPTDINDRTNEYPPDPVPDELKGFKDDLMPLGDQEALAIPWYATLGNHDTMYQGSVNNVDFLTPAIGALPDAISNQQKAIAKYLELDPVNGHGFKNMPAPELPYTKQEGYYSFSPEGKPYILCIILNTANFDAEIGLGLQNSIETFASGVLDQRQYDWMVSEIESNPDKLILVFSHHPAESFLGQTYPGYVSADTFSQALCSHENVIAHINGHTHRNRIIKIENTGMYWDINTCGILDWPQEWRRINIWANKETGKGTIECQMIQHGSLDQSYTYHDCLQAAYDDVDRSDSACGEADDRNVSLEFDIPATVITNITNNPSEEGSSTSNCFIATAAFGTAMEPEVITLRRFRDTTLNKYSIGRLFVRTYYRLSPPVAKFIAKRPVLRALARGILKPVIRIVK